ncbi:MAG: 2OG-Fe(II) oxygenase [Pseudomonadota bacterium]
MERLPADWENWVQTNVVRGVDPQGLIAILVEHAFGAELAAERVRAALAAHQDGPAGGAGAPVPASPSSEAFIHEASVKHACNRLTIDGHEITVRMRVAAPDIVLFSNLLSPSECEELIALSQRKLARSTTVNDASGVEEVHANRTSAGTFFHLNESPFIATLDRRIAALMDMPVENGEGLQILNYQVGGEYKPHFDYFPPELAGSAPHLARGGQRVATLIVYLNSVEAGGETIFPKLGVSVAPVQGSALYFAYTNTLGQVDPLTLHGGNPVASGEKWIATKWMRQRAYR